MESLNKKKVITILTALIKQNEKIAIDFKKLTIGWPDDSLTRSQKALARIFEEEAKSLRICLEEIESK